MRVGREPGKLTSQCDHTTVNLFHFPLSTRRRCRLQGSANLPPSWGCFSHRWVAPRAEVQAEKLDPSCQQGASMTASLG